MESYSDYRFTDNTDLFDEQIKKLEYLRDLCEKRIKELKTRQAEVEFEKFLKARRNLLYT